MGDNAIQTVLPKYVDKTIYYVNADDTKYSYAIKSTYKGILRLSPNNGSSLNEDTTVQLTDFSDKNQIITYKDSLNEFLDSGNENYRFVKLSTSDGYFVDMRLNATDVEFDNLYVDGVISGKTETPFNHDNKNTILLFTETGNNECFMLGDNTAMPTSANQKMFSEDADPNDPLDYINSVDYKYTLGGDVDNSAILVAKDINGKRVFQYKNTSELIEELVQEALMSFHTVPTGSVHFIPVSIEQYISLITNGSLPNCTDGTVNDPIVRDFLLCDGRKYHIKDFPELAKVLAGEKISYERLAQTEQGETVWRRFNQYNNYSEDETWFRVPDLRHMFIRSPYLGIDMIGKENNETGTWNVDNLPTIPQDKDNDKHYHFLALAQYNVDATRTGDFVDAKNSNSQNIAMVLNGMSANMPGSGEQYDLFTTCNATGRSANGLENHTPAVHFISKPVDIDNYNFKTERFTPDSGLTSKNIIDESIPRNAEDLSYGVYKNRTAEYNTSDMTSSGVRYGKENNPEFFACVPVIKI